MLPELQLARTVLLLTVCDTLDSLIKYVKHGNIEYLHEIRT